MPRYTSTERIGVSAVENAVAKELKWIFREQLVVDMGIDAQIELVEDGTPTGKLIAVQIKTGLGNFKDKDDELVYYGELTHLEYWTGHSLPVILVAHIPDTEKTYWINIDDNTVERTSSAWKVSIPKTNIFDASSTESIRPLFDGNEPQQRLRKLTVDEPLMRHIQGGGKVSVELQEWINKTLGRSPVRVYIHDEDGSEVLAQDWFITYTGYSIEGLACALFPWGDASVDEDFYEENEDCDFDELGYPVTSASISGFGRKTWGIRPYSEVIAGEVLLYRLKFSLNELGEAFLRVSDYMSGNEST